MLIRCPSCGRQVDHEARACPNCGYDAGRKQFNRTWLIMLVLFGIALCAGQWINYQAHLIRGQ